MKNIFNLLKIITVFVSCLVAMVGCSSITIPTNPTTNNDQHYRVIPDSNTVVIVDNGQNIIIDSTFKLSLIVLADVYFKEDNTWKLYNCTFYCNNITSILVLKNPENTI